LKDIIIYTTTCTSSIGKYPNIRYYSTNDLQYVGKFVRIDRATGSCGQIWGIFDIDGYDVRVTYTYEGTTCFVEVPEEELKKLQRNTIIQYLNKKLKAIWFYKNNKQL
jgi:hypothetical protein